MFPSKDQQEAGERLGAVQDRHLQHRLPDTVPMGPQENLPQPPAQPSDLHRSGDAPTCTSLHLPAPFAVCSPLHHRHIGAVTHHRTTTTHLFPENVETFLKVSPHSQVAAITVMWLGGDGPPHVTLLTAPHRTDAGAAPVTAWSVLLSWSGSSTCGVRSDCTHPRSRRILFLTQGPLPLSAKAQDSRHP